MAVTEISYRQTFISNEDRETIKRFLSKSKDAGYHYLEAKTGGKGLEISKDQKPDCILLDYKLPDTDGTRFMKDMAEHQLGGKVELDRSKGTKYRTMFKDAKYKE